LQIPGASNSNGPGARETALAASAAAPLSVAAGGVAAEVAEAPNALDSAALRAQLVKAETDLSALQGETPMIRVAVDSQIIGEVISAWTGIPVGKMMKDEISTVLSLPLSLGQRVIGQMHALEIIAQRISTSRARL